MIGRVKYHKNLKSTENAFSVEVKEYLNNPMKLFDLDCYRWREVGRFKTLDEAEEWLLSRNDSINYHGIKM